MISCVPCETLLWPCPATFSLAWIWQNFHSYNIFLWCNCTTETKFSYASQVSKDRSCFTSFPMRNPPLFIPCWEAAQITDAAYHSSCRPCGKCALLLSYILHTQKKKKTETAHRLPVPYVLLHTRVLVLFPVVCSDVSLSRWKKEQVVFSHCTV